MASASAPARPFRIEIPESEIQELKRRLKQTRHPSEFHEKSRGKWSYGMDPDHLGSMLEYWQTKFDWRLSEAKLNKFSQYKMKVRGLDMHFIHQKSPNTDAIPLLLVHGWPGSVWEFHKIIPMLTRLENGQSFHVIAPSLPGYGWSDAPKEGGIGAAETGDICHELMIQLGYQYYATQGGDWGAAVVKSIAMKYPNNCVGLHLNLPLAHASGYEVSFRNTVLAMRMLGNILFPKLTLSEKERNMLKRLKDYLRTDSAYFLTHATKPNTLGWGLNDSPAGLCAWIAEKCHTWTDEDLNFDEILTNVSIYWFTGTIASSCRMYYETIPVVPGVEDTFGKLAGYCAVPTAMASFPKEIIAAPKGWANLAYNLKQFNFHDKGGHFAAWEVPEALNADVREFYFKKTSFGDLISQAKHRKKGEESLSVASVFERDPKATAAFGITAAAFCYYMYRKIA